MENDDNPFVNPRRECWWHQCAAQNCRNHMYASIANYEMRIARGMSAGAYESTEQANIRPVVADIANINEAMKAYHSGNLKDHAEMLH